MKDVRSVEAIFLEARELKGPELADYLASCDASPELRGQVEQMLLKAARADAYFEVPLAGVMIQGSVSEGPGTIIGRYKLVEIIGEGGMGVVYRAEQREPVIRQVAIKIIKMGMDTKAVVARFEAERQALAMMDHPHIARVFDGGVTGSGRPYFVMELVNGLPVTQFCSERLLTLRQRLELILEVCTAIEHAHQKGIIHRDIKPSNILVTFQGDRPVPKVIDFGVAKATQQRLTEKTLFTQFQQIIGTPVYMSPEQASLSGLDIDTRSDIYSLGVLLYELLTGKTPFDGKDLLASSLDAMRRTILEKEPLRPSTRLTQERAAADVRKLKFSAMTGTQSDAYRQGMPPSKELIDSLRGDLDWIVMKCLEKDRTRRYETASGLAADIRRHLRNEPVGARPPSAAYRMQKAWRRHKPAFFSGTAVALTLMAGVSVNFWQSAQRQRALTETRRTLYMAQMKAVQEAWDKGDVQLARSNLRALIPRRGEEDLRGFEWRHFGMICQDDSILTLTNRVPSGSKSVAVSPDGSLLAWGDGYGRVQLFRMPDFQRINSFSAHRGGVFWLEFSRDGKLLASGGGDRTASVWDVRSAARRAAFYLTNDTTAVVGCVRLSADAGLLAASGEPGEAVQIWDIASGQKMATFSGLRGEARRAAFSPDGRHIALNYGDSTIQVLDLSSGNEIRKLDGHRSVVGVVEYSSDGKWIASSEANGTIKLYDTADWRETGTLPGHRNVVMDLAFSADSRNLASACRDGVIRVWDLESRTEIAALRGHSGWVTRLSFFPDGHRLASVGDDQTLKIWDLPASEDSGPTYQREPILHGRGWAHMRFSPDGRFLATVGADKHARRLWQADSGRLIAALPAGREVGAFSRDSRFFAASNNGAEVRVWSAADGKETAVFHIGTNHVAAVAFADGGELIAASEKEDVLHRWDLTTRQALLPWTGYVDSVGELVVSPDGRLLAAWCRDGNIRLRDLATGQVLPSIPHASDVPVCDFSPNGKLLAVTSNFGVHRNQLWDARSARLVHAFEQSRFGWCRPAFSADGSLFAISGSQSKIEVWDLPRKKIVGGLSWEGGMPLSIAFAPDGRTLAICDDRGAVRLWSMKMFREVTVFSLQAAGVRFSPDGNVLATHNIFRNNLLLQAASFSEIEADLASAGNIRAVDPFPAAGDKP